MVQLSDKHRGNTIDSRTTLLMDGSQHHERVELLDHHLRTAVRQTVHRSKHHTEAVEQGHTDTEFVISRKAHILACEVTIVGDTEVCQHHTLGEASRTTGILHVADIVARHFALHLVQRLVLDVLSQEQQLGSIKHTTVLLHTDEHHVLHVGETFAVQMTTLTVLQLWQHGVGHVHIVTVPSTISDTKGMHVRVLAEILQLVLLVVGIDGHQYGTNLGSCVKECQPVGHVGGPDTYVRAFLHTNSDQALGKVIHTLIELAPGEAKVTVTVDDVFFVWGCLSPVFEPLTECTLMELIALRARLGRICSVWQWSACHV